jgi:hypothetical protein
LIGGLFCSAIGIWWLFDGLCNGPVNKEIGGLIWKGPLMACAGMGLTYYSYRLLTGEAPKKEERYRPWDPE